MAYSLLAHTFAQSVDSSNVTTGAIDTSGAAILIVFSSSYPPGGVEVISDSKGNTWVPLTAKQTTAAAQRAQLWYAQNPTVGSGHTFSSAVTSGFPSIAVQAWGGALTASPFDQENGATTDSAASLATGSITPGQDNELVVAGASFASAANTLSINASLTISDQAPTTGGGMRGIAMAYIVQTSAGAVNPTWSWSGNDEVAVVIASFKASGSGGRPKGRVALLGAGR